MAATPPCRPDSPPALPDEIVEEILLRLPPDDPACILRASLVCRTWSCAVTSRYFRRRLHELHRTPPVLGFLHNWHNEKIPRLIPATDSFFSLAAPDRHSWSALECRHGRAVFLSTVQNTNELLVWEPITGAQRRILLPESIDGWRWPTAAVFCAADGCDHRDCHGGPFHLVCVFSVEENNVTSACLYSSNTATWGELTSMHGDLGTLSSSVLVGSSLLYFMSYHRKILEYGLARHGLTVLEPPPEPEYHHDRFTLMLADDGGLGLSQALDSHIKLWSRKGSDCTNAQWVPSRVIYLEKFLQHDVLMKAISSWDVLGFAEGANVIYFITVIGLFIIELRSQRFRKVSDHSSFMNLIPVVSFYTPAPLGAQQDSPTGLCYGKVAP